MVRFSDKPRHQLFLEPEGRRTLEYYLNGLSMSMPERLQRDIVQSVPGLEHAEIMRPAYAIEYDFIPPTQIFPNLETKLVRGLFFAGQINGTTGYEEAAAQGLVAGINAVLRIRNEDPFILDRASAYIGVLIDDLVTKGTEEPYRMFTSLAEYRLVLRQDNADRRLMRYGHENGLIGERQWRKLQMKEAAIAATLDYLANARRNGRSLKELLRRPEMDMQGLARLDPRLASLAADPGVAAKRQAETTIDEPTLRKAMRAFRTKLKATQLDEDSRLGVGPLSSDKGKVDAIEPPRDFPPAVWAELVRRGELKKARGGFLQLA